MATRAIVASHFCREIIADMFGITISMLIVLPEYLFSFLSLLVVLLRKQYHFRN